MKKQSKKKQRILQITIAFVLVLVVLLVEMIGIHPEGIYAYSKNGYKDFQIGLDKSAILRQINRQKTIRAIRTCNPKAEIPKKNRKKIQLGHYLDKSDIWTCNDRTGKQFLFGFENGKLRRLFIQRLRFGNKEGLPIFSACRAEDIRSLDQYLAGQDRFKVFFEN